MPVNSQGAAFAAIATRGQWNNQYMDLIIPLPQLPIWPAGRGLVIIEGERANHYDAQGCRPIGKGAIDFERDVVLNRINDNHYNVFLPSGECAIPGDGDCLFRAVITSWNRGGLSDALVENSISDLRRYVADYIFEKWETFKDFVIYDDEPLLPVPGYEQPSDQTSTSSLPVATWVNQAVETYHQAPHGEKSARLNELMDKLLTAIKPESRLDAFLAPHIFPVLLAPGIDGLQSGVFTNRDSSISATTLHHINYVIAHSAQPLKAERIERCMKALFSGDGSGSGSMAESILQHHNAPELKSVVNQLMTFMEKTAQVLKGEALADFGRRLGVDIAVDGMDQGIARLFSKEMATPNPSNPFRARFESLREEFGMAF